MKLITHHDGTYSVTTGNAVIRKNKEKEPVSITDTQLSVEEVVELSKENKPDAIIEKEGT